MSAYDHYLAMYIKIDDRDEAKLRSELTRVITACGYTESEAKEVIDYALSKTDREVMIDKRFFPQKFSSSSRIRVASAKGATIVAIDISK